jgi:hypothetical protein
VEGRLFRKILHHRTRRNRPQRDARAGGKIRRSHAAASSVAELHEPTCEHVDKVASGQDHAQFNRRRNMLWDSTTVSLMRRSDTATQSGQERGLRFGDRVAGMRRDRTGLAKRLGTRHQRRLRHPCDPRHSPAVLCRRNAEP